MNEKPNFRSLMKLKPNMTGTAMKNVNSAAATREIPMAREPMMVDPERDVPGMRERHWNRPMIKASLKDRSSTDSTRGSFPLGSARQ